MQERRARAVCNGEQHCLLGACSRSTHSAYGRRGAGTDRQTPRSREAHSYELVSIPNGPARGTRERWACGQCLPLAKSHWV